MKEIETLYNRALEYYKVSDIEKAISHFVLVLRADNHEYYSSEIDIFIKSAQNYLQEIESKLFVILLSKGWESDKRWQFTALDSQMRQIDIQIILEYISDEAIVPIKNVILQVNNPVDTTCRSDEDSVIRIPPFKRDFTEYDFNLTCLTGYEVNGEPYWFSEQIVFFIPGFYFPVTVEIDERMIDFIERLEGAGLLTQAGVLYVASKKTYPQFFFVPPPTNNINRFEGLFIPGTYRISQSDVVLLDEAADREEQDRLNAEHIISELLTSSAEVFSQLYEVNGLKPYELIILASIVEKEAVSNHSYENIAAVFHNRLKKNERLGSCPTVEYALGYHRPFLLYSDLEIQSPYNVYLYRGLPPTPICFFSDAALQAVLTPPENNLFFFVYDWTTGELHFAETFEEHEDNAEIVYSNYIRMYGKDKLHKKYPGFFYEDVEGH